VGFALPILLTWVGNLPLIDRIYDKLRPYVVYPSLIGTYHVRPLPFHAGNAPTVGQALYIAVMIILNIVLSAVNFKTTEAHLWFQNKGQQITGYLMYRTGVLSFAMAPLVVLFSGRNNFLQWVTNWQHSTFILLHRWIARLFVLQALLHTLLAVGVYSQMGIYEAEAKLAYWAWGVVATLFACIMILVSSLYFRRLSYELFLVSHIVMAVIVIVGSWYHVVERFAVLDGYTMWLWTASAVWFFDRLVRIIRIAKLGARWATVTEIADGYIRVDIPDVRWDGAPGNKAYVYFPSLSPFRPWENHPFSPVPFSFLAPPTGSTTAVSASSAEVLENEGTEQQHEAQDVEKTPVGVRLAATALSPEGSVTTTAGISLFIRKSKGMTGSLKSHDSLYTLLEGPYPNTTSSRILQCDRVLLFAGGIGITGVLPWTRAHHNVRLAWTSKESAACLVTALGPSLASLTDKTIELGTRADIRTVLHEEIHAGWARIGVVVCGPSGLCDDVRAAVVKAARNHRTIFELQVDAYSW
jgi:predicted ferric reductase